VNSFSDYESGRRLLQLLEQRYGNKFTLDNMRSATYHQQVISQGETQSEWTVFEGHIDKNFVHTVWFIPLTAGAFYTLIAVPLSWNLVPHEESERKFREWMCSMTEEDRNRLSSTFRDTFVQQATAFMNTSDIRALLYYCSLGSFLSFPANTCYHATVSVHCRDSKAYDQIKDLLIVYPMESG
jgi:hypothetical protein